MGGSALLFTYGATFARTFARMLEAGFSLLIISLFFIPKLNLTGEFRDRRPGGRHRVSELIGIETALSKQNSWVSFVWVRVYNLGCHVGLASERCGSDLLDYILTD